MAGVVFLLRCLLLLKESEISAPLELAEENADLMHKLALAKDTLRALSEENIALRAALEEREAQELQDRQEWARQIEHLEECVRSATLNAKAAVDKAKHETMLAVQRENDLRRGFLELSDAFRQKQRSSPGFERE